MAFQPINLGSGPNDNTGDDLRTGGGKINANFSELYASIDALPESVRDTIGAALTAGSGISVTVNDAGDTITISSSVTQYTDEMARDALGAALTAGTGIDITVNDGGDTITIATTGGSGGSLPTGGSTGQVLTKASATDGDATWQTVSNGRITPTLIQKVTQRAGGTFSLPAAPTAGNLLVWLTAGFNSAWSLAGFYVVGYFTTTNQVVACYARKVVAGDANSFTVGASDDKAGVLYEFQDATGVFPLTGGAMSGFFSSANFTLPLPPSLFATSDTRLLALESDTAAVWSVTPETGYSQDYVVPSGAAGNHYSVIGRLSDMFDGTLAGSTSGSPINPVFGLFEVVGR